MELTNLKVGIHVRYADDILELCKDYDDAQRFKHSVTHYLIRNLRLEINVDKTKIYDLTQEKMKYLGYDFRAVKRGSKNPQRNGMFTITNTLPKAKENEITEKCRLLLRNIRRHPNYETIY